MNIQLPEDFCCIKQVVFLEYPVICQHIPPCHIPCVHVLLSIPCQKGQIQDERNPVPINEEEESQKSVDSGFGNDISVEAVAEVDGIDVITVAKLACACI